MSREGAQILCSAVACQMHEDERVVRSTQAPMAERLPFPMPLSGDEVNDWYTPTQDQAANPLRVG